MAASKLDAKKKAALAAAAVIAAACLGLGVWIAIGMSAKAPSAQAVPAAEAVVSDVVDREIDWAYWTSVNPDIVGWLTIPGTSIDQPIVHAPKSDPTYYLSHDVYKRWNPAGAVYLDADCESLDSMSLVMFGHSGGFLNGMLGETAKYSDPSFMSQHDVVIVKSPDRDYMFRVDAARVIDGREAEKRTEFSSSAELNWWRDKQLEASSVVSETAPKDVTQMLTLVTCSYNFNPSNERTLTMCSPLAAVG